MARNGDRSFGPANDVPLEVTQELVALLYADDPSSIQPLYREQMFRSGLAWDSAPEGEDDEAALDRLIWESGALAAHLIAIGLDG